MPLRETKENSKTLIKHKIKYKLGFSTLINQGGSSHFHN